jgi:hypothetical protein
MLIVNRLGDSFARKRWKKDGTEDENADEAVANAIRRIHRRRGCFRHALRLTSIISAAVRSDRRTRRSTRKFAGPSAQRRLHLAGLLLAENDGERCEDHRNGDRRQNGLKSHGWPPNSLKNRLKRIPVILKHSLHA